MKINKWSIVLATIGAFLIVFAFVRWGLGYQAYYDPSQFAVFASVGVLLLGAAYLYSWMKTTDDAITKLDDQQLTIINWQRSTKLKEELS